ncbi:MAG: hypothetical protein ACKVQS_01410 [Fimbriimonadaceae bacterium]
MSKLVRKNRFFPALPDPKPKIKWHSPAFVTLFGTAGPLFGAWIAWNSSLEKATNVPKSVFGFALIASLIAAVYKLAADWTREFEALKLRAPEGLMGVCLASHVLVMNRLQAYLEAHGLEYNLEDDSIRITVYRVVPHEESGSANYLQRVMPYMGGCEERIGHKIDSRIGIVGMCADTGEIEIDVAPDDPIARKQMLIRKYRFSPAEAEQVRADRKGWAAFPITLDGYNFPVAVVFIDTSVKEYFEDTENHESLSEAIVLIQTYIEQRMK